MTKKTFEERFHEKYWTEPMTGCWLWVAAISAGGYGQIRYNDTLKYAHRASYELHNGPIPEGMEVCHRCDVPGCVAPHHLFLGTHKQNMQDAVRKGRSIMASGEGNYRAKLNEIQVKAILAAVGTQEAIAARFGVGCTTVSRIRGKKLWGHLHE